MDSLRVVIVAAIITSEFALAGYPLARKYLRSESWVTQLFYSHIVSVSLVASVLWVSYRTLQSFTLIAVISALLIAIGFAGLSLFAYDRLKMTRIRLSFEGTTWITVIVVAFILAVLYGLVMPFRQAGDAYGYYAPIGAFINSNLGTYLSSAYSYSLTRDFGYYAIFAQSDLIGLLAGAGEAYRLLPAPFVLGMILGVVTVTRRISKDPGFTLLTLVTLTFSVFLMLLLKYNMFYIGNLLMVTLSLLYCDFLLTPSPSRVHQAILAVSTFAFTWVYNLTLILVVPFAVAYFAQRKPRLTAALWSTMGLVVVVVFGLGQTTLGFLKVQQLQIPSSIALLGLFLVTPLILWNVSRLMSKGISLTWNPMLALGLSGGFSMGTQALANVLNFGFVSLDTYHFSNPVQAYMARNGWFSTQTIDIPTSLASLSFSDVFLGWGLFFTAYGLWKNRTNPIATYLLSVLPLILFYVSLSGNYFRHALFLGPLVAVFLALGARNLLGRLAIPSILIASSLVLLQRGLTTFSSIDFEHKAILSLWYVPIAIISLSAFLVIRILEKKRGISYFPRPADVDPSLHSEKRTHFHVSNIAIVLLLLICTSLLVSNLVVAKYTQEVYTNDVVLLNSNVLPLIPVNSKVLTVELVHPNFQLQKTMEVVQMAQPWILENFLREGINNSSALLAWLRSDHIGFVLVDRGLTVGNQDVFGLFQQLPLDCPTLGGCAILYNDGRFVFLKLT